MASSKLTVYPGQAADVAWDGELCIHVGECGRAAGDLFVGGRKPWCQPDVTGMDEVVDVVQRCPTGALTYARKDGGATESAASENTVVVVNNGPLYLRGKLEIAGADDKPGTAFRAALCRCGQSKNKPFCDNSHEAAGFRDSGAVGKVGDGQAGDAALTVQPVTNGPLMLKGSFSIIASSGCVRWRGAKAALCRCGQSNTKPFCDGSHKAAGFQAD